MKTEFNFTHIPTTSELVEKIRSEIPNYIEGKRLNHTFFVEKEAIAIAKVVFLVYNISDIYLNDVSAAALLHDLTKNADLKKQLELCKSYGIDEGQSPCCAILHGKTAAHLARSLFGINHTVFSAIFNHTTGCENMGLLDKIIFLADYTEQSRTHPGCIAARDFLHHGIKENKDNIENIIDRAILMSIDGTLTHLIESGAEIDINTVIARNSVIEALQDSKTAKKTVEKGTAYGKE